MSVLGIGGTGKTRLATRFARGWLGDFPGGVWFCDLSSARGLDGIVHAVAQALDVPLGADDPVQQLGHAIAGRGTCLVILDNFEQVTRHAAETLGRWLDRAAAARFLVTTREVLGLPGEEALALPPLAPGDATDLFMRRAAAAKHGFQAVEEDQAAIAQLVNLLDGLPLAIELAAARVRVMSPRALLARMGQRFQLLAAGGGRRDRQATLRATFDWSWDLLSDAEKAALAQLSVFEGGFTLEAVESVLDLSGCEGSQWPVDVLQSLVDKSFVRPLEAGRFDLLRSVQDYAAEHLRTPGYFPHSGTAASRVAQARHGAYFAALHYSPAKGGAGADIENLVAACRRATERGDAQVAVATLETGWATLKHRGPFGTAVELALAVAQMHGLANPAVARVDFVAGSALNAAGQVIVARTRLETGLARARTSSEREIEARILIGLGELHGNQARVHESQECHAAALSLAQAIGDRSLECEALNGLGAACVDLGRLDEARAHYVRALKVSRDAGNKHWEGGLLGNLGGLLYYEGKLDEAAQHFQAGLMVARELGNRTWEGNALCNLGALHQTQGRFAEALEESEAALHVARGIGHVRLESTSMCNLGLVNFALQKWDHAQAHYNAALSLARSLHDRRSEGLFLGYLGQLQARQGRFDEARTSVDAGEQLLLQLADPISLGLIRCHRVELELRAGDRTAALVSLAQARHIAEQLGSGPASELGLALARVSSMLRGEDGSDA